MSRRFALVVNPSAGGGGAGAAAAQAARALQSGGVPHRVAVARDLDHAGALAREAAAAGETVVAVGGDGLAGRLAGALADTGAALGLVPAGRGNDFALRALGLPADPGAAACALVTATERPVDLGDAGGRAFLGIASVGFDSEVNERANRVRLVRGSAVYPLTAVALLAGWRHAAFRLEVDGVTHRMRGFAVGVGSSGWYGGGMHVIPHARIDDGVLDVFLSGADRKLRFLRDIPRRYDGRHVENPTVGFLRGRRVVVDADRPLAVYADGERIGRVPVTVSVRPGALRVLAPAAHGR